MREIWLAPLVVLLLAAAPPASAQPAKAVPTVSDQDRVLGKPEAPITIIEYASMTCPHCAHFSDDVLPKIKEKWIDTGKAKLVLRDFPLDEAALRAAMLARCAPPERFYPIAEGFFRAQSDWVIAGNWRAALKGVAALLGIKGPQFDSCLADKALEDKITQSRLTASTQYGVDATPTFFVNGQRFEGEPSLEAFDKLLSGLAEKS